MKTIIVPIDFSEYSEYALQAAAILAKKYEARILAVHMLELATVHAYGKETETDRIAKALFYTKRAENEFETFLNKSYLEGIPVTPIIRHYKVFSELGEIAADKKADLIVMGSKGSSGLNEFFIGSNTERVVRHSEIPVVVIKHPPADWKIKKVVFATDFSDRSVACFQKAVQLLEPLQVELQLLHVNLPNESFMSTDEIEEKTKHFLHQADGDLKRLSDVYYVSDKSVEDGIMKYASRVDADLIAITTHGRTGLSRFFQGSISEHIANHGKIPLLTFKME